MIIYQKAQAEPTIAHKECSRLAQTLDKQVQEISSSIRSEFNTMKELSKTKVEELTSEADKQHLMPIFDDTIRLYSEKKSIAPDFINEAMKRALVNRKGVHFVDEQEL
jgi:DNA replication protein DnaD